MIYHTGKGVHLCVAIILMVSPFWGCEKLNLSKLPTSQEAATEAMAENAKVPPEILDVVSCQAFASEMEPYKKNGEVVTDEKILKQIQGIQDSLIAAAKRSEHYGKVANEFKWQLRVIDDKEPKENAFAVPCGGVGIHKGIFEVAQHEAGLAAILGHEDSHALARHAQDRMNKKVTTALISGVTAGGGTGAGVSFTDMDPGTKVGIAAGLGLAAGGAGYVAADYIFQPDMEYEADREGLFLAADAGYDPALVLKFWQDLKDKKDKANKEYEFLMLHPIGEDRYKELLKHKEKADKIYEQAKSKRDSSKLLPGVLPPSPS